MFLLLLTTFSILCRGVYAVSWSMTLPSGNSWVELSYILRVPLLPPFEVMEHWDETNIWSFTCGLEATSPGGGMLPFLSWGNPPINGYVGEGGWSQFEWVVVLWYWASTTLNEGPYQSPALSVDPGDQVLISIVQMEDGQWWQNAECVSGSCYGLNTTLSMGWNQFLSSESANIMTCESAFSGPSTSNWTGTTEFSDVTVIAANSQNVADLCTASGPLSDASGYVWVDNLQVTDIDTRCHWDYITVSPP